MASWFPTRAAGFVVSHTEWNAALAAMADWLGHVNAGGFNLSNVGAFNGGAMTLTGALSGASASFTGAVTADSVRMIASLGLATDENDTGIALQVDTGPGAGQTKFFVGTGFAGTFMNSMEQGVGWTSKPLYVQYNGGTTIFGGPISALSTIVFSPGGTPRLAIDASGWISAPNLPGYSGETAAASAGVPSGAWYWNTTNNSLMRKL
jgi:hypothetical protein